MLSIVGLAIWAGSLIFHFISYKTLDLNYQKILRYCSRICFTLWLAYWFYVQFFSTSPSSNELNFVRVVSLTHAAFLVISFALILVNALSSTGGLLKDWSLHEKKVSLKFLPSMESLMKTCHLTWKYAIKFWGLGLFLATFSLWLKYVDYAFSESETLLQVITAQPKLLVTVVLWLFLIAVLPIFKKLQTRSTQNYLGAYLVSSLLFVFLFSFLVRNSEELHHQALRWFLR